MKAILLHGKELDNNFRIEAVNFSSFCVKLSLLVSTKRKDILQIMVWIMITEFGIKVSLDIPTEKRTKFDPKNHIGMLNGYNESIKGYTIYFLD